MCRPPDGGLALVLELANYEAYHLKGPSLWDSIKTQVGKNMEVRVYKTRAETIDGAAQFRPPLTGGEAMCRWIFLQVCDLQTLSSDTASAHTIYAPSHEAARFPIPSSGGWGLRPQLPLLQMA
jgi:hypothetical protein